MTLFKSPDQHRCLLVMVLPTTYALLVILTAVLSTTYGHAYDKIVGVNPIGMGFMMIYDNPVLIFLGFLVSGTPWWYFIARIGCESRKGRIGRITSVLGLVLALATFGTVVKLTGNPIRDNVGRSGLSSLVIVQYCLVTVLCSGALLSALFLLGAIFRKSRQDDVPI